MNNRFLCILRHYTISSSMKRSECMKKHGIFHSTGERVMITSRKIPPYAKRISNGNSM
jgi:hypothetical protein